MIIGGLVYFLQGFAFLQTLPVLIIRSVCRCPVTFVGDLQAGLISCCLTRKFIGAIPRFSTTPHIPDHSDHNIKILLRHFKYAFKLFSMACCSLESRTTFCWLARLNMHMVMACTVEYFTDKLHHCSVSRFRKH